MRYLVNSKACEHLRGEASGAVAEVKRRGAMRARWGLFRHECLALGWPVQRPPCTSILPYSLSPWKLLPAPKPDNWGREGIGSKKISEMNYHRFPGLDWRPIFLLASIQPTTTLI